MAKATANSPTDEQIRNYADRLILEKLTELYEVVKPSEISDQLADIGLGLAAVRSLLASNAEAFAFHERRWIPVSRLIANGLPINERIYIIVSRFGGPMPVSLLTNELSAQTGKLPETAERIIRRTANTDFRLFLTNNDTVVSSDWAFAAWDETIDQAYAINNITHDEVQSVLDQLGKDFKWRESGALENALAKLTPVHAVALGAAAWLQLNSQDPTSILYYDWRKFNAELFSRPDLVFMPDGRLYPISESSAWIKKAVKLAEKIAPTIEIEDAQPLELKSDDVAAIVQKIKRSDETVQAIDLLEQMFEITPSVKTFPDDMANLKAALAKEADVWWVGGDRFRKPDTAPEFIYSVPEPFEYVTTDVKNEEGELVDVELSDEGLNTSLRKLLAHPLATDVNDEDEQPPVRNQPDSIQLVIKSIHRELGTFPLSQFVSGWFDDTPAIQELIWRDPEGNEHQVWLNHDARLLFNLLELWLDQPVESGAVFSLSKTTRPNVFDFEWQPKTDPVVTISTQRMEELREIAANLEGQSTFDCLREVMSHWPKGADFLTILWELNVVRRTSRRLLASLLSGYACFYQRSGSPVWHYDAKKLDQGFDKSKKKFIKNA